MRFVFTLGCVLILIRPATAVDYDKIERNIVKEPAYRTGKPKYALLLFGPEARLRVWVVLDGETLYIDRNGDGDLTGKDERFAKEAECTAIEIPDPDRKTWYTIDRVMTDYSTYSDKARQERARKGIPPGLMVYVSIKGALRYQQYCDIQEMRADPHKAMIAHFHGPLAIGPRTINWKVPDGTVLNTGAEPSELYAVVGTMNAKHGCWVVVRSGEGDQSAFPKGVRPVVEIAFPSANRKGKPVRRKYRLDQFC
jgi:hypothetical protein